jgi:uncharacterized protein (TIGR00725 family)
MPFYYKIAVSGAEETRHCKEGALEKAKEIGKEIVRHNGILLTGATSGIPYWAAIGAKEEGGISIGFSPAVSERDHKERYKMPTDYFDIIIFTGFGYSARNLLLMKAADAVIFICGRTGTLNEWTICFEDQRLMGVLEGTGGTADMIKNIVKAAHKGPGKIIYDKNPKRLVERLIKAIDREKRRI